MDSVLEAKVVSVKRFKPNIASPILATFQNAKFKTTDHVCVQQVTNPKTEEQFALVATPESVYKSDMTNAGSASIKKYLAFHNKKTKQIKLVQVHEADFKHTLYDNKHSIFEANILDSKKELHKKFGGKKALSGYERLKKTAPNIEILTETLETQLENIDDKVFERDIFDQSEQERKQLQSSIFPDIDLSQGQGVRDVFTTKKMLGQEILEHLLEMAIEVLQTEPADLPFATKYLNDAVRSMQISKQPDSPENLNRVALFIYIDGLVRVINSRKRTLQGVELAHISDYVSRDIRQRFSFEGNQSNSKFTRQKSIIYYIIMALISTESLQIELDNLLDGIDITKTELLKYAEVIGAKVKNKTTLYIQKAKLDNNSQMSAPTSAAKKRRRN